MKAGFLSVGFALVLTCTTADSALAACGVGNKLWEGNNSAAARVVAFTTNLFTFYGISTTFEIAGCTEKDNIFKSASAQKVRYYASTNFDRLASDIARGHGEHLDGFTALLELDEGDGDEFKAFAQENLVHLIPRDDVTAEEFLAELGHRMAGNATLSRYVER